MKHSNRVLSYLSSLALATIALTACGTAMDLLDKNGQSQSTAANSSESDTQNLLDGSFGSASGMTDPQFKPFRMEGLDGPEQGDHGPGHGPGHGDGGGRGHHKGPHGGGPDKRGPAPLPADIAELMKSADAKKDSVLGIDRTKIDPILKAMQTDLEALRAVSASRDDFMTKAKEIQAKYSDQLKAVLPAFDSLTQEQKDRVKAIHDLQKKVIDSCVARGADSTSATCTTAKSDLKANIDAP
ncbi:hypothetical protein EBR21_04965 [bacterium]|nr:hypothetical protein [bacterium]